MNYCEHSGVKLEESNESRLAKIEGRVETFHEHRQYITQKKLTAALKRAQIAERKCEKLKRLMLLTDPMVSDVEMNTVSARQWNEFIRCFPDEGES